MTTVAAAAEVTVSIVPRTTDWWHRKGLAKVYHKSIMFVEFVEDISKLVVFSNLIILISCILSGRADGALSVHLSFH